MKVSKFIKLIVFTFLLSGITFACTDLTGSTDEKTTHQSEISQPEYENRHGILSRLPEGTSLQDIIPTNFKQQDHQLFANKASNTGALEGGYSLEILPFPDYTYLVNIYAFNDNGSTLYEAVTSNPETGTNEFILLLINKDLESTIIYRDNKGVLSAVMNNLNEVAFTTRMARNRIDSDISYVWTNETGLQRINFNVQSGFRIPVVKAITNNSKIYSTGINQQDILISDLNSNIENFSQQIGHENPPYQLGGISGSFITSSILANQNEQVAFRAGKINGGPREPENEEVIGFYTPGAGLEYFGVTRGDIENNGAIYMEDIYDMNNSAQIVGRGRQTVSGNNNFGAAKWVDGDISFLNGSDQSMTSAPFAQSINDEGYIVGSAFTFFGGFRLVPFIWSPDGSIHEITSPEADLSLAPVHINNENKIVGVILIENEVGQIVRRAALLTRSGSENEDTTPPSLSFDQLEQTLWPANHKLKLAVSGITSIDDEDPNPIIEVSVSSSESQNGTGDGNTNPDWEIAENADGTYDVYLRAERNGAGSGRIYTIEITATDVSGNTATESLTVSVPHDRSGLSVN